MPPLHGDDRLRSILEQCYAAIGDGREPDLDQLCAAAPELRAPVERMLRREREALPSAPGGDDEDRLRRLDDEAILHLTGQTIGEFSVLEPIGRGGMSHVFRARQEPLGREVALKVLHESLVPSERSRLRFQREASITAALDHPNIVPVYAAGEDGNRIYLAMKLLRGASLDRLGRAMTTREIAALGATVASALQAAHAIGVVHRDVKPANIVIEDGHPWVVDFGLAAFAHHAGVVTRPDSTPGTLIYLPPEMARRSGDGLDARVDVYGLGATLYELIAGRPPFDPDNAVRALHQILHVDPEPLRLRGRDAELETIVRRAMDKQPERRFPTAGEMAAELQRFLDGVPIRSRRTGLTMRVWRLVRRHPGVSTFLAVTAVLICTLAIVLTVWAQEHQRRIEKEIVAVRTAIAVGDVTAARKGLEDLVDLVGGAHADLVAALQRECDGERQLQLLVAMEQGPIEFEDKKLMAELVDGLGRAPIEIRSSLRAQAARAVGSRLLYSNRLDHLTFDPQMRQAWPRTAEALGAWSAGTDPRAALAQMAVADSVPLDHLFAALILRICGSQERDVEAELRRADQAKVDADSAAIAYSLAISLEAQGRFDVAYGLVRPRIADPVYGGLASAACARLAAGLRWSDLARHHLEAARLIADADLGRLLLLSRLQVLHELRLPEEFARLEEEARPLCEHLPLFWRLCGYQRSAEEQPKDARECFERGLAVDTDHRHSSSIRLALLQLDWSQVEKAIHDQSTDPAADPSPEGERLAELATRAEALAAEVSPQQEPEILAEVLIVAAQIHDVLGQDLLAERILDRVCTDYGAVDAVATYADLIANRCRESEGAAAPVVDAASRRGSSQSRPWAEAAARVVAFATTSRWSQDPLAGSSQARCMLLFGALTCAEHLGDVGSVLALAADLRHLAANQGTEEQLPADAVDAAQSAIATGGQFGDGVSDPDRACEVLFNATGTVERLLQRGRLTVDEVRVILRAWRTRPPLDGSRAPEPAGLAELRQALEKLERRL